MKITVDYTRIPGGYHGKCNWHWWGCEILIDPVYRDDKGLVAHEWHHARGKLWQMWWRSIKYKFSKKAVYKEELSCYTVQFLAYGIPKADVEERDKKISKFAEFLREKYDIPPKYTKDAKSDLERRIHRKEH